MNILIVSATLDPIHGGGIAERSFQLSQHLAAIDNQVTLLTLDLGLTAARREQFKTVNLSILPCLNSRFFIPKNGIKTIKNLVKAADSIHLMGHWSLLNAITYFYIRKYHKKYFFSPGGAYSIYGRSKLIKGFYNAIVGSAILKNADTVIAITPAEATELKTYTNSSNIIVLPNGINPEDYQVTETASILDKYNLTQPYILFLGRLNEIKGPDLLLDAFIQVQQQFPEYQLIFAGPDDGMQAILEKKIMESGLNEKIHLIGYVGGKTKAALLQQAHLLVIPSRSEAMSIVVLEAAIVNTVVLVTDRCGVDELAQTGGVTIVTASVSGLAQGLVSVLIQTPATLANKATSLHQYILEHYSWSTLAQKFFKK